MPTYSKGAVISGGIAIITGDSGRHGFFARTLIESGLPVHGLITGAKRRPDAEGTVPRYSAEERLALKEVKAQRNRAEKLHFGTSGRILSQPPHALWVDRVTPADGTINNKRFAKLLAEKAPSAVAVMGAAMIGPDLLTLPCPFVNMHTGLSPYYRGGRTNMWPILEGEFGYFGVTVHKITSGIDNGAIFASKRIDVIEGDTYPDINARSIIAGARLMVEVLKRLLDQPAWSGVEQWVRGKLFFDKHYTPAVAAKYLSVYPQYIAEHLQRQKTGDLGNPRLITTQT